MRSNKFYKLMTMFFMLWLTVKPVYAATCTGILTPEAADFIDEILGWIQIIAPALLIVLGAVDFGSVVFSEDKDNMKKATSKFVKRCICAVAIFFVPLIVKVLMNITGIVDDAGCVNEELVTPDRPEIDRDENNDGEASTQPTIAEPVKPTGDGTIVYKEETDTLKVSIQLNKRTSGLNYYTTYIWVKDAYAQFKSEVPSNYGKEKLAPITLMQNAVSKNNLQNKLVVGINASGFEPAGNPYSNTPAIPYIVSNGKVIRDFTDQDISIPTYNTYGITKNGILKYYEYKQTGQAAVTQEIKNDGVLNTFGFIIKLVENGKIATSNNSRNVLQGICQIDKNNFLFITDDYGSSRKGFTYKELANYMISLGCQTGYNMDGGGSTQLIFKSAAGTPTKLIKQTSRAIPDIIYFHQ